MPSHSSDPESSSEIRARQRVLPPEAELCLAFGVLKSGKPFDPSFHTNLAQNLLAKA